MKHFELRPVKVTFSIFLTIIATFAGFAQTTIEGSFVHNGLNRTYRLYIPEIYNPSSPTPLLFNLHGLGSNAIEQEAYGDFRPIADTANFIIAHANGTVNIAGQQFWNTFGGSTVDDVGFISALIDTISAQYNIDPNRIYSTGMSNGGFMSYDLACFLSHRIAAVASVTGGMIWSRLNTCNPEFPTPVMQIHGTLDATVPYNGNFLFSHVDTLVNHWVRFNSCNLVPEIIPVPDNDPNDGCTAERHLYSGGNAGSTVELFKVLGGGHSWPGAPINLNITNMDFSASKEIWRFFRQYSLDQLMSSTENIIATSGAFKIFPNPATESLFVSPVLDMPFRSASIEVYDARGSLRYASALVAAQTLRIETSSWKSGLYYLVINADNGQRFTEKILVR